MGVKDATYGHLRVILVLPFYIKYHVKAKSLRQRKTIIKRTKENVKWLV